jgi:hypothetical protein
MSALLLGSSAALLMLTSVAFADPATPAPAPAAATQPANDPNQIVCKTEAAPTGSRLGAKRTCATQHDWDVRMRESQQATFNQEMKGLAGGPPGN